MRGEGETGRVKRDRKYIEVEELIKKRERRERGKG